jgi:DNA polymerase-3 subunit beta
MNLTINKTTLLHAVLQVQNVIAGRTTLPILSNIKLTLDGNNLMLTATDLDITLTCTVQADGKQSGATTLPAARLSAIVKQMPDGDLTLDVDDKDIAQLRAGTVSFKIYGLPSDSFPAITEPEASESTSFEIAQADLADILKKTRYAACKDETRHVLQSVYMEYDTELVATVATDGRRLATVRSSEDEIANPMKSIIMPTKAAHLLAKMLTDQGVASITASPKMFSVQIGESSLLSKTIDGQYPNYKQVIPADNPHVAWCDVAPLMAAIRRSAIMADNNSFSTRFRFRPGSLEIHSMTKDVGEAIESMAINYDGPEHLIGLNPDFMLETLATISDSQVVFRIQGAHSPIIVEADQGMKAIVMPMRINA